LVGKFMWNWSYLEFVMNQSLAKLVPIDGTLQAAILTTNLGVRDKLKTIKTLLNLYLGEKTDAGKAACKVVEKIGDLNDNRNTVAHTYFTPHAKGVEFHVVKASGAISFPNTVWTDSEFQERITKMTDAGEALQQVVRQAMSRWEYKKLVDEGRASPSAYMTALALLAHPATPPLGDPDSQEANPETEPQTPPVEKE